MKKNVKFTFDISIIYYLSVYIPNEHCKIMKIIFLNNTALLWQREATLGNDISHQWAKCVLCTLTAMQKLQNAAARIVTLSPKRTHITPILQSLHWLPIKDRIVFKILLLIFHCVQGSAPQYNISLVHPLYTGSKFTLIHFSCPYHSKID